MHVRVLVLAHHTVSMDTRVALTVIDICLTVGAGKADYTCALVSIDNVLWYSFHIREQYILSLLHQLYIHLSDKCWERIMN